MSEKPSPALTQNDVRNYLNFLREAGFLYLVPGAGGGPPPAPHRRAEQLEALRQETARCAKCGLAAGRTHVVFGEGNPDADVMFVGEAPGRDEDSQGRPFVGRAGQLLDTLIGEVGLRREEVFIGNVIKCRPPGNRDPELDEIQTCEPYLLTQIALIRPRVIVALGRFAAHTLSGTTTPITRMRGKFHLYHDVKLMPTFHPAAVLRNPSYRADIVADFRRAVALVGESAV
ncbi:MAG TPA: uracil-DNA glycosylase [Sumerlaeia bacterium]|nr:uracil-DNA glycosylase [Sumerlaeia bacterium]